MCIVLFAILRKNVVSTLIKEANKFKKNCHIVETVGSKSELEERRPVHHTLVPEKNSLVFAVWYMFGTSVWLNADLRPV